MNDRRLPVIVVHGVGSGHNADRAGFSRDLSKRSATTSMPQGLSKATIVSSSKIMVGRPITPLCCKDVSMRKRFYDRTQVTETCQGGEFPVTVNLCLRFGVKG